MAYVEAKGHRLHVEETGQDDPQVVFLSSTGLGARQWRHAMSFLQPRRCLALNYLDYPGSDVWKGEGVADWEVDLEAARALILAAAEPVDVVGHSFGGWLALQLARAHPERIRRIALHEPVAWGLLAEGPDQEMSAAFDAFCARMFRDLEDLDPEVWLTDFIRFWNGPGVWEALPDVRKTVWRKLMRKIYAEVRACCTRRFPMAHWSAVSQPTLVLVSADSPAPAREVCRLLVAALPDGHRQDVPGAHLAPITHADDVTPHIAAWLACSDPKA